MRLPPEIAMEVVLFALVEPVSAYHLITLCLHYKIIEPFYTSPISIKSVVQSLNVFAQLGLNCIDKSVPHQKILKYIQEASIYAALHDDFKTPSKLLKEFVLHVNDTTTGGAYIVPRPTIDKFTQLPITLYFPKIKEISRFKNDDNLYKAYSMLLIASFTLIRVKTSQCTENTVKDCINCLERIRKNYIHETFDYTIGDRSTLTRMLKEGCCEHYIKAEEPFCVYCLSTMKDTENLKRLKEKYLNGTLSVCNKCFHNLSGGTYSEWHVTMVTGLKAPREVFEPLPYEDCTKFIKQEVDEYMSRKTTDGN